MDIANAFVIVGSVLGVIVIGAMAILPSVWELDAGRPDHPRRSRRGSRPAPSADDRASSHQDDRSDTTLRAVPSSAGSAPAPSPTAARVRPRQRDLDRAA